MRDYKKIYEHMGDQISKEIFGYRLLYTETGDLSWISNVVKTIPEAKGFVDMMSGMAEVPKAMFGAGDWGKCLVKMFPGRWECFVDNFCNENEKCCNLPVVSFKKYIESYKHLPIVVSSDLYHEEMTEQLRNAGVAEDMIMNVGGGTDFRSSSTIAA